MLGHDFLMRDHHRTLNHLLNLSRKSQLASQPPNEIKSRVHSETVAKELASPYKESLDVIRESLPMTINRVDKTKEQQEESTIWIFGYGSLIWKCDYPILRFVWGSVSGYKRRLWQGSPDHRGTPKSPGRVFTLLPCELVDQLEGSGVSSANKEKPICWGRCFELEKSKAVEVMKEIDFREIAGFSKEIVQVTCVDGVVRDAIMYAALPNNDHFLGFDTISNIATHCFYSSGPSGRNDEYVTNTMNALEKAKVEFENNQTKSHHHLPFVDSHLSSVCKLLKRLETTSPLTSRSDFQKSFETNDIWCRGRLIQLVSPPTVKDVKDVKDVNNGNETAEWPIVYYIFVHDDTKTVYHCNVVDDASSLPFTKSRTTQQKSSF